SLACGPSWLTWMTVPSWTLLRAPMRTKFTSPRTTVPGHSDTSSPSTTSPTTVAIGSTYTRSPSVGITSRYGRTFTGAAPGRKRRRRGRGRRRGRRGGGRGGGGGCRRWRGGRGGLRRVRAGAGGGREG